MIAFTWDRLTATRWSRATLYEEFMLQVARGKIEQDTRAEHRVVKSASSELLETLRERSDVWLGSDPSREGAMLWLMSRVAWLAHGLEQQASPENVATSDDTTSAPRVELRVRHLQSIGRNELQIESRAITDLICGGLLLVLQSDPEGGDPALLFGHRSFHEFLVGRYWAAQLLALLRPELTAKRRRHMARSLYSARLLSDNEEDRCFDFLTEIIQAESRSGTSSPLAWNAAQRQRLVRWTLLQLKDESLDCSKIGLIENEPPKTRDSGDAVAEVRRRMPQLRLDRRLYLREAALALACRTRDSKEVCLTDGATLLTLLAGFQSQDQQCIIRAPGLRINNLRLSGALLQKADLRHASLKEADLTDANLSDANLQNADLCEAKLWWASLRQADLRKAWLSSAELYEADLRRANLEDAEMQSADLRGADLRGAKLAGCNLMGSLYDRTTLWPSGFDVLKAQVRLDREGGV